MSFMAVCSTKGCVFNLAPFQEDNLGLVEVVAHAHESRQNHKMEIRRKSERSTAVIYPRGRGRRVDR